MPLRPQSEEVQGARWLSSELLGQVGSEWLKRVQKKLALGIAKL